LLLYLELLALASQ